MKGLILAISICFASAFANLRGEEFSEEFFPASSLSPSAAQKAQIARKYGMFIHFGINTFHDSDWTDGSKPPSSYAPKKIDAEQWVRSAKDGGMRYVILVAKHHDGFCLWDSKYTEYDVANSANATNVVEEVAKACKKFGLGLGLYYSLWDRKQNADVSDWRKDADYNAYMLKQLEELMDIVSGQSQMVELWLDGGWVKPAYRWPISDIYKLVKAKMPACQIGVNWTIGSPSNIDERRLPHEQKEGYPIRYFPSDFRLGDPYLPAEADPKIFIRDGKPYYMPFESTVCISQKWFYHTGDKQFKSVDELEKIFLRATRNDNILILNCPPTREGRLRERDVEILKLLYERIKDSL